MKWYFASNDKSESFYPLIKGAVNSAIENTSLKPHFLYDGEENELTDWLKNKGVKIIHHRVSFYDALKNYYPEVALNVASGAFLRCDIPIIEQEDDFVLYTDCDVLFLKDVHLDLKPESFACSSQSDKNNFRDFNTGVMLMNVQNLRKDYEKFSRFIAENLKDFTVFDQSAYQIFYSGKNTKLPLVYNHKPYWGIDENAVILHFHGAKPTNFTSDKSLKYFPGIYDYLYRKNPNAYDCYLELFKKYHPEITYYEEGIKKLKIGEYSIHKYNKSLINKLKNRIKKEYQILVQNFK